MSRIRVAAAAYPISRLESWGAYREKLTRYCTDARDSGADLLVFPEYGSMELVSLLAEVAGDDLAAQLEAMQRLASDVVDLQAELAAAHGLYVLAASFPTRESDGGFRNRAWLLGPEGGRAFQDKLQMTRFEAERWGVSAGSEIRVFDTRLGRIGVAVCYDAEFPLIVRRQVEAGADLILVPSCTDTAAGYWRVRIAAQARALENQCFTVQSSTVGAAPWSAAVDVNTGAAGVFGPVDSAVASDGILAMGGLDRPGLVFADLDFGLLELVRTAGEVLNARHWGAQAEAARSTVQIGVVG